MLKTISTLVIAAAVAMLAFLLNPSADKHRETMKQAIADRSPIAGALGIGALTAFVSTYHTAGVLSYTIVNDRVVTIGAFGTVVLLEDR